MQYANNVYIGCSGFMYDHWYDGVFYPKNVEDLLEYYSSIFNTVEINATFYRIPKASTVEGWSNRTPEDFKLILKGPKSFSHTRRMKLDQDDEEATQGRDLLKYFVEVRSAMDPAKQGPMLLQIAPSFECDLERLRNTLQYLSEIGVRNVAFEMRHRSWMIPEVKELLIQYGASLVACDWPDVETPIDFDYNFLYIRRHGTNDIYTGLYPEEMMKDDAELIAEYRKKFPNREVYVYFNNDDKGYAPRNARQLNEFVVDILGPK